MQHNLSPLKAIRANCLECSGNVPKEVKNCIIPNCPMYQYRMGFNLNRSKTKLKNLIEHPLSTTENESIENEPKI